MQVVVLLIAYDRHFSGLSVLTQEGGLHKGCFEGMDLLITANSVVCCTTELVVMSRSIPWEQPLFFSATGDLHHAGFIGGL